MTLQINQTRSTKTSQPNSPLQRTSTPNVSKAITEYYRQFSGAKATLKTIDNSTYGNKDGKTTVGEAKKFFQALCNHFSKGRMPEMFQGKKDDDILTENDLIDISTIIK